MVSYQIQDVWLGVAYLSKGATLVLLAAPATAPDKKYELTRKLEVPDDVLPTGLSSFLFAGFEDPGGVAVAIAEAAPALLPL